MGKNVPDERSLQEKGRVSMQEVGEASRSDKSARLHLVKITTTLSSPTQARYLVQLDREVIVFKKKPSARYHLSTKKSRRTISNLITQLDLRLRVDHDLLLAVNRDDLRGALRVARMVDKTSVR